MRRQPNGCAAHRSPEGLAIARDVRGVTLVLHLTGRFDAAATDRANAALRDALDSAASRIVIDLQGLASLDAAGVAFLLRTQLHCAAERRELALHGASPVVLESLRAAGLLNVLPLRP